MKKFLICFLMTNLFLSQAFGQQQNQEVHKKGPRRQLATIVFAGLGGAILGLSTLSFYGRPQDNLSNIAIGFAVGVIAGTAYVTFKSATSHDYYDDQDKKTFQPPEIAPPEVPATEVSLAEDPPNLVWAPLIKKNTVKSDTSLGGQVVLFF